MLALRCEMQYAAADSWVVALRSSMRTYSTPESALNQEITKLAIIETVVAVTLYIGIAIYFGTFKHLAVAVVVAPLMLFRTEASAEWGFKVYEEYAHNSALNWLYEHLPRLLFMFVLAVVLPVGGSMIRVG